MRHHLVRTVSLAAGIFLTLGGASTARETRIADAAEQRARTTVVALLKQGADVNAPQPDGATALHWAAHWDEVATATDLLHAGANPNAANDYGVTPLFLAATNGNATMIAALLKAKANPNAALPTGQTVLMTAARTGNVAAVEALLAAGAAVDATQAAKGQTALMWAIAEHHGEVTRVLLAHGAAIDARTKGGFTPLLFAAREGDLDTTRLLLAKGADVNESSADGVTPLLAATVRGYVDLALFFLDHGARPDGNAQVAGYTPLHWAATTFETTPITYPGVLPPGEWAAMAGIPVRKAKMTLITALVARGADINAHTTKRLINQASLQATFTTSPSVGATPFHAAAGSADAEVMRLLMAHGADPSIKDANNETALMIATAAEIDICLNLTEAKRLEVVRLARELGNDLEAADNMGHHALHLAARGGFHEIITYLVQQGADLNPKTKPRTDARGGLVAAQTPLALSEGTVYSQFHERQATAEFLRKLGAKSEGRYFPHNGGKADTGITPRAPVSSAPSPD